MQTAAASLVASLPAVLLSALLVMVILNYGVANMILKVVVFATLGCAVSTALLPGLIVVFWNRRRGAATEPNTETVMVSGDADAVSVGDEDIEVSEDEDTEVAETVDFDTGSLPADAIEGIEIEEEPDTDQLGDDDLFADDIDEEEEPPPPKKKKW